VCLDLVKRFARETGTAWVINSADNDLNAAASSEGLIVDNPNLHP
jgi:hypothetical protein